MLPEEFQQACRLHICWVQAAAEELKNWRLPAGRQAVHFINEDDGWAHGCCRLKHRSDLGARPGRRKGRRVGGCVAVRDSMAVR